MTDPQPWRVPEDVAALSLDALSDAEQKMFAELDSVRADLERLRAGAAALANRAAAANLAAVDAAALHSIGHATDDEFTGTRKAASDAAEVEAAHAVEVAALAAREAALVEALEEERIDAREAFRVAMLEAKRASTQRALTALVEASRATSELFSIIEHGRRHGLPDDKLSRIFSGVRADNFELWSFLNARRKEGYDVPELPINRAGPGTHGRMLDA